MFSIFYTLPAVVTWLFPIFTVIAAIVRPDQHTKKEWLFLLSLTLFGAILVTVINFRKADELLVDDGQKFEACTLIFRSYPAGEINDIVKLKCGGATMIVNAEHYDDAIAAAKRHEDD